jgi:hypothetical protein
VQSREGLRVEGWNVGIDSEASARGHGAEAPARDRSAHIPVELNVAQD